MSDILGHDFQRSRERKNHFDNDNFLGGIDEKPGCERGRVPNPTPRKPSPISIRLVMKEGLIET